MPACKIIMSNMLRQDAVREIEKVSLSNSTISRHIDDTMLKRLYVINWKTASLSMLMSQQISPINVIL
jgi:hypothetical protein